MTNKKYSIEITKNGFIIEFEHTSESFRAENQYVALSLGKVIKIIKEDMLKKEVDLSKTGAGEETKDK
jgi:uncharacterized protein YtpQ (UPF0354 family)